MPSLFAKKSGQALWASDRRTKDTLDKIKEGAIVRVDVKQPRNAAHSRKYWAILHIVADNTEVYDDAESLHEAIKLRLGMYDVEVVDVPGGKPVPMVRFQSISFASMDQLRFRDFYDRAMSVIRNDMGFDIDALEREAA